MSTRQPAAGPAALDMLTCSGPARSHPKQRSNASARQGLGGYQVQDEKTEAHREGVLTQGHPELVAGRRGQIAFRANKINEARDVI